MNELSELIDKTGMSPSAFARAVGVRENSISRMLLGDTPVPEGLILDGHQLLADIDYVQSLIDHNPDLQEISHEVWKLLLTQAQSAIC